MLAKNMRALLSQKHDTLYQRMATVSQNSHNKNTEHEQHWYISPRAYFASCTRRLGPTQVNALDTSEASYNFDNITPR